MARPLTFSFIGGPDGPWHVERIDAVAGDGLAAASRVAVMEGTAPAAAAGWTLRGVTSNLRYAERPEVATLVAIQAPLMRPQATRAALIPIGKTAAWWELAQDERRAIFAEQSRHIAIGLDYLPGVARRLHHSRELGEPFDFLTWFEYAPEDEDAFDEMLRRLRATREWHYVEREVDVRLRRAA